MKGIVGILAVVIVIGAGFSLWRSHQARPEMSAKNSMQSGSATSSSTSQSTPASPTNTAMSSDKVVEITLVAKNWGFDPAEIHVKQGDKVKITLTSESGIHALAIPELHVSSDAVHPGESVTVEFTADKKGTYTFKCSVPCGEGHRDMTGKLVVE